MNILVLFARHGLENYQKSFSRLAIFYKEFYSCKVDYLIIDNALPDSFSDQHQNITFIGGDNYLREFSAFEKALNQVDLEKYDLLHFVTSAFQQTYSDYLNHFTEEHLIYAAKNKVCVGHVDRYPEECIQKNNHFQSWIRSCFFFLSPKSLKDIDNTLIPESIRSIFEEIDKRPLCDISSLSENYRKFLSNWLYGTPVGGVSWHSPFKPETGKINRKFNQKLKTIILEHSLSIRMRSSKIRIIDVGYSYLYKTPLDLNICDLEQSQRRSALIFW